MFGLYEYKQSTKFSVFKEIWGMYGLLILPDYFVFDFHETWIFC